MSEGVHRTGKYVACRQLSIGARRQAPKLAGVGRRYPGEPGSATYKGGSSDSAIHAQEAGWGGGSDADVDGGRAAIDTRDAAEHHGIALRDLSVRANGGSICNGTCSKVGLDPTAVLLDPVILEESIVSPALSPTPTFSLPDVFE